MSNTKIGPITTLKDTLREVLVLIVQASKSATSCTEDEFIDKFITLRRGEIKLEPVSKLSSSVIACRKAGQVRIALHKLDQEDESLGVFSDVTKTLAHKGFELIVAITVHTAKNIDVVARKFERRGFEADAARRQAKDKSKVDMNQVALCIDENIAVVAVFDL